MVMKKEYVAPRAEVVKFEYKDQVVAASGGCEWAYRHEEHACSDIPVYSLATCNS
jgi:hypothetical protein